MATNEWMKSNWGGMKTKYNGNGEWNETTS